MTWAIDTVIGEWIRREAVDVEGQEPREIQITLNPIADGVSRARRGARYTADFRLMWRADGEQWFNPCTVQGYPVAYTVATMAAWLSKVLPGSHCTVTIRIQDAATMGPAWTDTRLAAVSEKLGKLDAAAIRAGASAKQALADKMADGSAKKDQFINAASAMREAADALDALRAAIAAGG